MMHESVSRLLNLDTAALILNPVIFGLLFWLFMAVLETKVGFYSWLLIRTLLKFVLIPLFLVHWLLSRGCTCGNCPDCREEEVIW